MSEATQTAQSGPRGLLDGLAQIARVYGVSLACRFDKKPPLSYPPGKRRSRWCSVRVGFLDQFTLTVHRGAAMLALEDWSAFDTRFGGGASQSG